MPSKNPNAALSEDDIADLADLIDEAATRTEEPLSLEGLDGFITALQCAPRSLTEAEYFPVLFGQDNPVALFNNAAEFQRFHTLLTRRWKEIARALAAPIDSLSDPQALVPLIMDWEGMLAAMPKKEAAADWELPPDSKDEAFADEMLDPLYVLMTPPEDWTDEEREKRREDYVAMAIWSCYELRDFWRDRGQAPRH